MFLRVSAILQNFCSFVTAAKRQLGVLKGRDGEGQRGERRKEGES